MAASGWLSVLSVHVFVTTSVVSSFVRDSSCCGSEVWGGGVMCTCCC